jgi:hypothetical protein
MRRTHASLARERGIDPKLVADQLGHGLGVNLDVYTVAALGQRQHAVQLWRRPCSFSERQPTRKNELAS